MADKKERKIPVFTVLKNGSILKNIFFINKPPPPSSPPSVSKLEPVASVENGKAPDQEMEDILIVGRHPDCNITLTHPSISRFHLQINTRPSSQKLFVTDLSSVHGTWISEKKIEPGVRVELSEGDTIRVGGSTRVYRLHWVPMDQAYDMENSFVSAMDTPMKEEKEEEIALETRQDENSVLIENEKTEGKELVQGEEKEICQIEEAFSIENECFEEKGSMVWEGKEEACLNRSSLMVESEDMQSMVLTSDGTSEQVLIKEIPSAPPMPESLNYSIWVDEDGNPLSNDGEVKENSGIWSEPSKIVSGEMSLPTEGVISEAENKKFGKDNISFQHGSFTESVSEKEKPEPKTELLAYFDSLSSILEEVEVRSADEMLEETENKRALGQDHQHLSNSRFVPVPFMTESMNLPLPDVLVEVKSLQVNKQSQTPKPLSSSELPFQRGNNQNSAADTMALLVNLNPACPRESGYCPAIGMIMDIETQGFSKEEYECENSQQVNKEFQTPQSLSSLEPPSQRGNKENAAADQLALLVNLNAACPAESGDCPAIGMVMDIEMQDLSKEEYECDNSSFYSVPTQSANSSLDEVLSEKSKTPESVFAPVVMSEHENFDTSSLRSEKGPNLPSIWSRRNKPANVLKIQTGRGKGKPLAAVEDVGNKSKSQVEEVEDEIYTPDKENFTPNTLLLKSLKRKCRLEEIRHTSDICRSSSPKIAASPCIQSEEDMIASSDKENQTPKGLEQKKSARRTSRNQANLGQELLKRRAERTPFQSLFAESSSISISEVSNATTRSSKSFSSKTLEKRISHPSPNNSAGGRNTWTMVADTTSLMDSESMKSIQLLQGLKGTQLIIPRMVIRELDCLKRRGNLFGRKTKAASVLEWIEDCMVKTKWWIHVQSSEEEGRLIAPTPPASPRSQFSERNEGFPLEATSSLPFSPSGSLKGILSPTAEDHILDCALLYRNIKSNGHLVLLSEVVTMKIKAMAEGLLCETAQEFRGSLVNPFSERFMWADSSPRGRTWSVLDDVVLREQYTGCPLKKSSKGEAAKGLKLILLHNSHYGQISSVR